MATHPLWLDVYERIEHALLSGPKTTKELEYKARLYPLGPTLREMEELRLIKQTAKFTGEGVFYNPTWRRA